MAFESARPLVRAICLAAFTAVAATAAAAQDLGPLTPVLELGESPPWLGAAEGSAYVLSNSTDPGAVRYFWIGAPEGEGQRTIGVDVEIREAQEASGAGLIYGYQEEPRSYFLLLLRPGNQVALLQRTDAGVEERMSLGGDMVRSGANRLEIRERGQEIELLVNGQSIGSIGNDRIGRGGVGIAAAGTGTFVFSNFAVAAQ